MCKEMQLAEQGCSENVKKLCELAGESSERRERQDIMEAALTPSSSSSSLVPPPPPPVPIVSTDGQVSPTAIPVPSAPEDNKSGS